MKIKDFVFVYHLIEPNRLLWHGRYHAHDAGEYEFHYFLEGSGSFLNNRIKFPLQRDCVFLTGPNEFHCIISASKLDPISYYAVLFEPEESDGKLGGLLASQRSGSDGPRMLDKRYRFLFDEMRRMTFSDEPGLNEAAKYQLLSFIYSLYSMDATLSSPPSKRSPLVERALDLMQKSIRTSLTIGQISKYLGVTEEHFIRIFRRSLNMTPLQYFTRLKVEASEGCLTSSSMSVGAVSEFFGFENQFHYSRVFKRCTGLSPQHYRKRFLQLVDFSGPTGGQQHSLLDRAGRFD